MLDLNVREPSNKKNICLITKSIGAQPTPETVDNFVQKPNEVHTLVKKFLNSFNVYNDQM